ncbi:LOW QUALITY PROTEIN: hypothetical protein CVT25_007674 [Psilocybe cyanescens]|uniref:Uncharacterized protein n=1 Tax=Psilocybe cyanescens TaxID=93625 RepID=A0A409XT88_PSICY|nr:LOW QUALITY PROTEIN: hypothetical protein CVT25_007674 [Psilocybe cyanescens]
MGGPHELATAEGAGSVAARGVQRGGTMWGPHELATAEAAVRHGSYGGPTLGYPTAGLPSTATRTLCVPSSVPRAVDTGVCTCVQKKGIGGTRRSGGYPIHLADGDDEAVARREGWRRVRDGGDGDGGGGEEGKATAREREEGDGGGWKERSN